MVAVQEAVLLVAAAAGEWAGRRPLKAAVPCRFVEHECVSSAHHTLTLAVQERAYLVMFQPIHGGAITAGQGAEACGCKPSDTPQQALCMDAGALPMDAGGQGCALGPLRVQI